MKGRGYTVQEIVFLPLAVLVHFLQIVRLILFRAGRFGSPYLIVSTYLVYKHKRSLFRVRLQVYFNHKPFGVCYSGGMVKNKVQKTTKTKKPAKTVAAKAKKTTTKSKKVATEKVTSKKTVKKITNSSLYVWNKWLALLYLVQGVAIIIIGAAHALPVTTSFLTKDTFTSKVGEPPMLAPAVEHLFDINLVYLVAAFLFVAAVTHILFTTVYRKRYEQELAAGVNRLRWAGFGVAGALMLVTIGLISGVQDISLLLAFIGLTLIANLSGLGIEVYGQAATRRRLMCVLAWTASMLPWLVVAIYLLGANIYGSGDLPGYVYGIAASLFILFLLFARNMYLQHKRQGKWTNYLYGERAYNVLMFIAASALAWQVFAGALQP